MMKSYSAVVKDGSRVVIIRNKQYPSKAAFIQDLRGNGFKVNPQKVKPSGLFDYIMEHTNCESWDWALQEIPNV